jgi:exopolyphosphatase/guanosine-5'-triphosphate,3'-diphosphate pyrophosphatase
VIDRQQSHDASLRLVESLPYVPQPDPSHAAQVTILALALFDALAEPLRLIAPGRHLLAAAAYWHDTGQAVAEKGHHKHSLRLILETEVPPWSASERLQVACIARYHRKALPRPEHAGYRDLSGEEREQVRVLASLLRMADGLDYSHRGLVRGVDARLGRSRLDLVVEADAEAQAELWRAGQKADLFRQVFARDVVPWRRA